MDHFQRFLNKKIKNQAGFIIKHYKSLGNKFRYNLKKIPNYNIQFTVKP